MNPDFQSYLEKKSDMYDVYCGCGAVYYIFVTLQDCYSLCPSCNKKNFEVMCEFCKTGFRYPEDSKQLNIQQSTWTCEQCKKINSHIPNLKVSVYNKGDLPKEILKESEKRRILPRWVIFLLLGVVAVAYIIQIVFNL